jgi:membrane glycosyltransferase
MASRLHLFLGASAYLTSPGWLLLLVASILRVGARGEFSQPADAARRAVADAGAAVRAPR